MTKQQQFLHDTLRDWSNDFIRQRIQSLQRRKAVATGELTRDMRAEMQRQAANEAVQVVMYFEGYGRILDMKQIDGFDPGRDMIENLKRWIEAKGIEKFAAGYVRKRGYRPSSREKLLTSIAWGVAKKRSRDDARKRRKAWWNRPKSAAITDLYNEVAVGLLDITAEELVGELGKAV